MRTPRGIAVVDLGATNSKVLLFDAAGQFVTARKMASGHRQAPPYAALDPDAFFTFVPEALRELDQILPIDAIVPCAHGSALACLDAQGQLALPIMDYTAQPPEAVRAAYAAIAPDFSEVFCPVAPLALCLGLQLFWQQTQFPEPFARVTTILPLPQYVAYRLCGVARSEITTFGAQSQLWDVPGGQFSSLVKARGWATLFAPMVKAWDILGELPAAWRGNGFRGDAMVHAGVHDSNANYLRYVAGGKSDFTLLSTGTWVIGFAPNSDVLALDPTRDTVTNSDVFGRPVACCRFMGGREFEIVAGGADPGLATVDALAALIARGTYALPSFTASGGPVPDTGNAGRIIGAPAETPSEQASLATLYTALMTNESLRAVRATGDIIIDGPFGRNPLFLGILAGLRPNQAVMAPELEDGTAAGAALLARMDQRGALPLVDLALRRTAPIDVSGLSSYAERWLHQ
jgi:sugar (pentulose or hexulose) kinase